MKTLEELQAELAAAASETPPNVTLIQALGAEIARLDPDNVRFTTDAGIISRLGQELVGRKETAVAELIKNAYDADATQVTLTFSQPWRFSGEDNNSLRIDDDGVGMTRDQLLEGFMRLSSNDKLVNPVSILYHRRRAGRKGIGRFAVQRLGESLVLTTQTAETDTALRIVINWDDFKSGVALESISNRVEYVPKEKEHGTTLLIQTLRDSWSDAELNRVYRYASELLQPFPLTKFRIKAQKKSLEVSNKNTDPGFKVSLVQRGDDGDSEIASQEATVFSHALAVIEGYVDSKGEGVWSVESEQLGLSEEVSSIGLDRENIIPFKSLRNVSLKAYYYIWLPEFFPRNLFGPLRDLSRSQGGIRVFRNGFRVPPYGNSDDDWLSLDYSQGARIFLPPHGNQNFLGFIQLDDPNGELFEEKTSREGLLENDAFDELQKFGYKALTASIIRIAEARERKQSKGQTDWQAESKGDPKETLAAQAQKAAEAVKKAQKAQAKQSENKDPASDTKSTDNELRDALGDAAITIAAFQQGAKAAEDRTEKLIQELEMLRILASLGLVIGEFTHEIRHTLGAMHISVDDVAEHFEADSEEREALATLSDSLERLKGYSAYFYNAVTDNAMRQLIPQDLRSTGYQFLKAMEKPSIRVGVVLTFDPQEYELFTPAMHTSELSSILFNFYSNSLKAIRRAKRTDGKMLIRVGRAKNFTYLEFADNGDGIPEENKERIFNAFFTTSTPASRDSSYEEESQGSGLGLKIVKDIVSLYQGQIELVDPPHDYSTCFRVEFPATPNE